MPSRHLRPVRRCIVCAASVLLAACVHTGASSPAPASGPGRSVLSSAEIARCGATTALDAIAMLRPSLLRPHAPPTPTNPRPEPGVYVDGLELTSGLDGLRGVPSGIVREIRYLDGPDATTRFGTGHSGGAILVTTFGGS